jgi:sorting nexin-25
LPTTPARPSLLTILLQPSTLSYWMEFMDRRDRSLLVQFWLIVEGLKDPLEDLDQVPEHAPPDEASDAAILMSGQTSKSDIEMIWTTYLAAAPSAPPVRADSRNLSIIKDFVESSESVKGLARARRAIFAIQRQVFEEMEEVDYGEFVGGAGGDLYIKVAENLQAPQGSDPDRHLLSRDNTIKDDHPPRPPPRMPSPVRTRSEPGPSSTAFVQAHKPSTSSGSAASVSYLPSLLSTKQMRTETATLKVDVQPVIGSRSTNSSYTDLQSHGRQVGKGKRKSVTAPESLDFLMGGSTTLSEPERAPLFEDDATAEERVQEKTIEALQEALTSILSSDSASLGDGTPSPKPASVRSFQSLNSPGSPVVPLASDRESDSIHSETAPSKDNSSLVVSTSAVVRRRKAVFHEDDDALSSEVEPEPEQLKGGDKSKERNVRFAGPGELQLPVEITEISERLARLQNQQTVVDAMIRKAELTGTQSELKILAKSADALRREARDLTFQKSQYEAQATENTIVPGRTNVSISGTTFSEGADGRQFVLYVVEVHQVGPDGTFTSGWFLTRRYSEFSALHATLREKYAAVRSLDLPSKRLVTSMNTAFIEQRRAGLEKYLQVNDSRMLPLSVSPHSYNPFTQCVVAVQALVKIPAICQSAELRSFLSQQNITLPKLNADFCSPRKATSSLFRGQGIVRSLYRSVTSGIDDMFAGPAMMEQVIQRLSQQAVDYAGLGGTSINDEDLVSQAVVRMRSSASAAAAQLGVPPEWRPSPGGEGLTYFTTPICDLFIELFQLKEKNNWLRKQAIVLILQQVLGGTIERYDISLTFSCLFFPYTDALHVLGSQEIPRWAEGPPRVAQSGRDSQPGPRHLLSGWLDQAALATSYGSRKSGDERGGKPKIGDFDAR